MSRLLAVAARELRERWLLFPTALVLGCVPLVLPAFGLKTAKADLAFVALFIALLLGAAAAVIIGSTMLARDVANGRLGFLFSRPVPWGAIWGGKWLAAIVLVAASGLLASVPWMAVYPPPSPVGGHGDSWLNALLDGPGAALCLTLIVLIVGLANLSTVALRSRSAWLVVDGALLLASLWATWRFVAPLLGWGIVARETAWAPVALAPPATLALVVASVTQVVVGRSDLHRAHRAASLGFWAVIALSLALAAGYLNWALAIGPRELRAWAMTRDPAGRWVFLGGEAARSGWYPHGLLVDTQTGRYIRRGPKLGLREVIADAPGLRGDFPGGAVFSASGRACALPGYDASRGGMGVTLFDLTAAPPRSREVVLESSPPPSWASAFALSPSAASLFMVHESGASLFDLASGRRLATVTIKPGWRPVQTRFLAEGQARAWLAASLESRRAEIAVVDLALDGRSRFASFAVGTTKTPGWGNVMPNDDGTRVLTWDDGVHLRDGADGRMIATLSESGLRQATAFMADGRVVIGEGAPGIAGSATGGPASLTSFDATGVRLGTVSVPIESTGLSVGPEAGPGRILVSAFRSPFLRQDTLVVDLADGRLVERLEGLRPAIGFWTAPAQPAPGSGPHNVQFFRDTEMRVVRVDFATGERRTIAGPGAPKGERLNPF